MLGANELSSRFARFLTVWAGELAASEEPVLTVDARYPAGVAVAWAVEDGPVPSLAASVEPARDGLVPSRAASAEAARHEGCDEDHCPAESIDNIEAETLAFAELAPSAIQRAPSGPPPRDE